jgi:hypothetical protein
MLGKEPFRIIFSAGVVRFDAHGNLFVNLDHSEDAPQKVLIGGPSGVAVAAPEKRARVHGTGGSGAAGGAFLGSGHLPRGLTVEVKNYESAMLEDGNLIVCMASGATIPDWWESAKDHHFGPGAAPLRIWVKSSMPEGVSVADRKSGDEAVQPKPMARAQFQPKSEKATPVAEKPLAASASSVTDPASKAEKGEKGEPYRPGRLPAGHLSASEKGKSGLGCSTLTVVVALAAVALVVVL